MRNRTVAFLFLVFTAAYAAAQLAAALWPKP